MATCTVSGNILGANGSPMTDVVVKARLTAGKVIGSVLVAPNEVQTSVDTSGNFTLTLQQSVDVIFTVQFPPLTTETVRTITYSASIPATVTANFATIITQEG